MSGIGSHQQRKYKCPWCSHQGDGTELTCPACGASIDVRSIVTDSGWVEVPGIKDMTSIQFGKSHCQIEGLYVPVADMNLSAEDSVYFAHHVLLWMDTKVNISAMPLKGAWKRMLSGMPLIMTEARGPGHIAFSKDAAGELVALPLQPGQAMDVREHVFMVATGNVSYDWFQTGIWYTSQAGNDSETHYPLGMFMDRFSAPQKPGLLLLHAAGNCFVRNLRPNETILVKPTALLFKDPQVQMQLHIEHPAGSSMGWFTTWSNRYIWVRLYGPGRVAIQSAFEKLEDTTGRITNHCGATIQQW
jgi:uncharacterized protein (AIM24 family)